MDNHQHRTTITEENTPLPIVYYPGVLGSFIAFGERPDSEYVFCECFKIAIRNYFLIEKPKFQKIKPPKNKVKQFHTRIIRILEQERVDTFDDFSNCFSFERMICHECNEVLPSAEYSPRIGTSTFKQTHGWYINKLAYEYGINPYSSEFSGIELEQVCPKEIIDLVRISDEEIQGYYSEYEELRTIDEHEAHDLLIAQLYGVWQQKKEISHHIENIVRERFGFKKIGEGWVNETNLYHIICSLYQGMHIIRHYRPPFLRGLELDIFVPHKKLGIEYQGKQHTEPVEHWGGEEALAAQQARDKLKRKLCLENGIHLIYFHHYETITMELVRMKLKEYT